MDHSTLAFVADRFLLLGHNHALDLATGEEVWIRIEHDQSPSSSWAERCAALYARRHPCLVELADYGLLGRTGWFEAFRTRGRLRRWTNGRRRAVRTIEEVTAFFRRQGLSEGALTLSHIVEVEGRPRVLPDEGTGLVLEAPATGDSIVRTTSRASKWTGSTGIVLQARVVLDRIVEFVEEPRLGRARWLHVRAPAGSGISTTIRLVAREVRLKGLLPVAASLVRAFELPRRSSILRELLPHVTCRQLVVLSDHEEDGNQIVRGVLALRAALLHADIAVVSVSNRQTLRSWVAVDPLRRDQLVAMIGDGADRRRRVSLIRAAQVSRGWPGRFVTRAGLNEGGPPAVALARERAPVFGSDRATPREGHSSDRTADLDAWRRLSDARTLVEHGRHAGAARAFRTALGMFERRQDALHAGTTAYELGQLLVRRGAVEDACQLFARAGKAFREVGAVDRATSAAAAEGSARMEAGELRVAEALLQTAEMAGVEIDAHEDLIAIRAALVRCLQFQDRINEAANLVERDRAALKAAESAAAGAGANLRRTEWYAAAAFLAVHRRAHEDATTHVSAAMSAAKQGPALAHCLAHHAALALSGLVGDLDAVRLHATSALEGARLAHAPVESLRVRLTLIEALGNAGAPQEARAVAARLLRRRLRRVPALVSAQRGVILARALPDSAIARALGKESESFAHASGAVTLRREGVKVARRLPQGVDDIVDLIKNTHEYVDEDALLMDAAQFLRSRLAALTVEVYATEDLERPLVSVGSGHGVAAARAVRSGILLGPIRTCAGIEMAVPIRCGRTTIGALGCRWSAAGPTGTEHAQTLLATAAAMCSPFVRAVLDRRRTAPPAEACPELLGVSQAMTDLRNSLVRAASAPFPVLIVGESGVGKELVARAIHRESPRRLRNFAALNCAALTEDLVEAELFGHARGAFTGAIAERRGLFEEADGGTLFLDEVSELSPRAQAKLLRVLQEGEVRRVGESFARRVEVRVIAATNRSLEGNGAHPAFRQDLRYRLDVIRLDVPPLRDRVEDIPILATTFWARVAPLTSCHARLSPATLSALACHDWPGNVRELQNVIAALAVAAPRRGTVAPSALPAVIARAARVSAGPRLEDARLAFERRCVAAALARAAGHTSRAAKELGISRQGLTKLMKRIGVGGRIQNTEYRMQEKDGRKRSVESND
jgi:two-component system response regulator HydG